MIVDFLKRSHRWAIPLAMIFFAINVVGNQKHKTQCISHIARPGERGPSDPGGKRMRHPSYNCIKCHDEGCLIQPAINSSSLKTHFLEAAPSNLTEELGNDPT